MSKRLLRPGLLTAAAIFLSNPFVSTLDVLPDAFAWLFMLLFLSRMAEFVPHFDAAVIHAKKLLLITALKAPSFFLVSSYVAGDERQRVMYTLVCFSFTVVEMIWLFPFFKEFFAGIDYLAERHGLTALVEPRPRRGKRSRPSVAALAEQAVYIALPAKLILAVLPEFALLSSYEASGTITTVGRDLASFRPVLTLFAFAIGLVFGLVFLINFIPLCRMLRRNEALHDMLSGAQEEALAPLKGRDRILRVRYALWCMAGGSFCMIDAVFDGINYLPDALGVLLFGACACLLLPLCPVQAKITVAAAGVALPVSIVTYLLRHAFFAEYSYEALGRIREADALYSSLSLFSCIESACLVLLYAAVCVLLIALTKKETGYQSDNVNNYSSHLSLHKALGRKAILMAIFGTLATTATTGDVFLRRITERYKQGAADGAGEVMGGVILPVYGWFWLIVLALCLLHFVYTLHVTSVINDEVAHKYSLS